MDLRLPDGHLLVRPSKKAEHSGVVYYAKWRDAADRTGDSSALSMRHGLPVMTEPVVDVADVRLVESDARMRTIGIIGAGEVGSQIARAAIATGYEVVIANSRGPETLAALIADLGRAARAAWAVEAAAAGDVAVIAVPLKLDNDMPAAELAGKIVLDTNNYMAWRDGTFPMVESGATTVHELRQKQLPASKIAKAFTHVQAPRLLRQGRPAGDPDRLALAVSSDFPEAVELVSRLYDEFGFDAVDNSPLSESWRSAPNTPMWRHIVEGQTREQLVRNLAAARRAPRHPKGRHAVGPTADGGAPAGA